MHGLCCDAAARLRVAPGAKDVAQADSVDCQATNFQPWGVFVQALRNSSLRLRGWPPISASIAARPVMSATSPKTRTLRSPQFTALYFALPDFMDSSQLGLVSVLPEECVYKSCSCTIASSALTSPLIIAPKRLSSRSRISFSLIARSPLQFARRARASTAARLAPHSYTLASITDRMGHKPCSCLGLGGRGSARQRPTE